MGTTTGTKVLTYPNSSTTDWTGTMISFFQAVTDYMDALEAVTELVNDTSPQLGGQLSLEGFDIVDANGNEMLDFTETTSAINHFQITNAATGSGPTISAVGDDTNIGLALVSKGTGAVRPDSNLDLQEVGLYTAGNNFDDGNGNQVLSISSTTSAVNYLKITNAATGSGPLLSTLGDDTNRSISFLGKGTGKVIVTTPIEFNTSVSLDADSSYDLGSSSNKLQYLGTDAIYFSGNGAPCTEEGLCKVWVKYDQSAASVLQSYNISSVTDVATGKWTPNFSVTVTGDYVVSGGIFNTGGGAYSDCYVIAQRLTAGKSSTSCPMKSGYSNAATNFTFNDYDDLSFFVFGDNGS